jgi:hypothetical protein
VYGLGRFPATLYHEQWIRLLDETPDLRAFLEENKSKLKLKRRATGLPRREQEQAEIEADWVIRSSITKAPPR